MEYWSIGVSEEWSNGVLEYWGDAAESVKSKFQNPNVK